MPAFSLFLTGFTLRGNPHYTDRVEKSLELLPTCAMRGVEKGGLKGITVVRKGTLSAKVIDGRKYNVQADSFFRSGNMYIDESHTDQVVVLHEMGHWYSRDGVYRTYAPAWERAVDLDYADLPPKLQHSNAYLKDPFEAWAELFAYHYLGQAYWDDKHYDVDKFTRSNAMMDMILEQECK